MTSGSHGKPYAGWTLPDVSNWGGNDIQTVNRRVMEQISACVHDVLDWLVPNHAKRTSDEHYSSDSSEDAEVPPLTVEMAKEYFRMRSGIIGWRSRSKYALLVNHGSRSKTFTWALWSGSSTSIFRRHIVSILMSSLLNKPPVTCFAK